MKAVQENGKSPNERVELFKSMIFPLVKKSIA
jgi:hypothetical protein